MRTIGKMPKTNICASSIAVKVTWAQANSYILDDTRSNNN
jgi:hypothetical protein